MELKIFFKLMILDVYQSEDLKWAKESMGLLEDRCEVEATYRRRSSSFLDWPLDLLGHPLVPPAIVEALNCPNRCSNQGVCLSHGCLCQSGFSGSDCSLMDGISRFVCFALILNKMYS